MRFKSVWKYSVTILVVLVMLSNCVALSGASATKEIEFMHMTWWDEGKEIVNEAIEQFESQHPDVKISQTIVSWTQSRDQLMLAIGAGVAPDITMGSGDWNAALISMGVFESLDNFVPEGFMNQFVDPAIEQVTVGEHIYGIPQEGCVWGCFYRKDLFEKAGLDPDHFPSTWDELLDYAIKLTEREGGKTKQWGLGFAAGANEALYYWLPFVWQAGGEVYKQENGGQKSTLLSPEVVKGTQFYYDLIYKYKVVPKTIPGEDWEAIMNGFIDGRFGMMFNGMWVIGTLTDRAPELRGSWGTAMMPKGPVRRAAVGWPNTLAITKQSKDKKQAWEFIESLYSGSPSFMDRYAMSISSLNWTKQYLESGLAGKPLYKPFVQTMEICHPYGQSKAWDPFRITILNPALQALIGGERNVMETLQYLHDSFNRLHGVQ